MTAQSTNFQLRPAHEADAAAIARCSLTALSSNPVSRALHGPEGRSDLAEASMQRDLAGGLNLTTRDAHIHYVVAETMDGGAVVGCAKWHFYPTDSGPDTFPAPSLGTHGQPAETFFGGGHALRQRHIRGRPCAVITMLAVDPACRARGIGTALVQWGLARADAQGLDCWLVCTPAAHRLYTKCGFHNVDLVDWDLNALAGVHKMSDSEDWGENLARELKPAPPPGHYRAVLLCRKAVSLSSSNVDGN